ncbi:uncharacterized protein LOC110106197 [Dendrobium catenatum]|uniref:YqaJ viral recombinase domain-containing protein n=1 Tax=Dendrobium catenatum TaxID=906689 RepID=A0A2I0X6Q7_9ASPA|nr:uncharacterized protein LOC110106197 [Dendrobium catenatum]PKU83597.1 hypothetical protein MA16_Dca019824 [Dendrobium catenatum]
MRLASAHSSYVSFGLNRPNAPNVFDHIPLRAGSLAVSFTGAAGMRSAGAAFSNRSVHNFCRANRLNRISSSSFLSVGVMTHAFLARSKLILSKKNYEGYIPGTFTSSLLQPSHSSLPVPSHLTSFDPPQRSEEWFTLRKDKLTTSSFSTALGFWKGNRRSELWQQKVFSPESNILEAAAVAAMNWGVVNEAAAIECYKGMTGQEVSFLGFAVHAEATSGWLGASPDGLVGCYPNAGILEVKCPYNKGKPELGLPWQAVPYYYMPQVQGQMEIMDRNWVDLYCWTPNGSVVFRIFRDLDYWELMHQMLQDFWWGSVVPARQALMMGNEGEAKSYEPKPRHDLTGRIIGKSRKLAAQAKMLCRDIGGHVEFFK